MLRQERSRPWREVGRDSLGLAQGEASFQSKHSELGNFHPRGLK